MPKKMRVYASTKRKKRTSRHGATRRYRTEQLVNRKKRETTSPTTKESELYKKKQKKKIHKTIKPVPKPKSRTQPLWQRSKKMESNAIKARNKAINKEQSKQPSTANRQELHYLGKSENDQKKKTSHKRILHDTKKLFIQTRSQWRESASGAIGTKELQETQKENRPDRPSPATMLRKGCDQQGTNRITIRERAD